jgi:hypothetical protein
MSNVRDYQVDHLLLLVGSNPVPNAVAGKLLTAQGGTITLIYSRASFPLAKRLKSWLADAGYSNEHIGFREVDESDAASVYSQVNEVLVEYDRDHAGTNRMRTARTGLNYTGGTKVMSVHAYRTLEQWARKGSADAVFSYLDARTLHMRFEQSRQRPPDSLYVGREVTISVRDLIELHNWKLPQEPITEPTLPESAAALLAIHSSATDAAIWSEWLQNQLYRNARKLKGIDPPFWVFQKGQEVKDLPEQFAVKQARHDADWEKDTQLQKLELSWPDLPNLCAAMKHELGQGSAEILKLTAGKEANRFRHETAFCKWLDGLWLESAVLSALQGSAQELHLSSCSMGLKPSAMDSGEDRELFEFDVVAIRGYQLFAFSCTTEGSKKYLLKQKLFEAAVRARQMGGDEACIALVCCAPQDMADALEKEMGYDLSPKERIKVFGRAQLAKLSEYIAAWVREQSKEG